MHQKKKNLCLGNVSMDKSSASQVEEWGDQTKDSCRQQWFQDLEIVFKRAVDCEKFSAALKAKEMIAKVKGWIKSNGSDADHRPISTWGDDEIDRAVSFLKKNFEAETGVEPTYKDLQSSA